MLGPLENRSFPSTVFLVSKNVSRALLWLAARRRRTSANATKNPTMTRATTVNVPPTAPLFAQKPLETAFTCELAPAEDEGEGSLAAVVTRSGELSCVVVVGVVAGVV